MSEHDRFAPKRFPVELPPFASWRQRLLALGGSVARVAADIVFDEKAMTVQVYESGRKLEPPEYPWAQKGRGTLLAGCHRSGGEAFFLAGLIGEVPGKELRIYAKPYGLLAQGLQALAYPRRRQQAQWYAADIGRRAMSVVTPVVPGKLERGTPTGRKNIRDRLFWWMGMRQRLPTGEQITALNARSKARMTECVEEGGAGLIFPTGRIGDATKGTWRQGIGEVLLGISADRQGETDIVPFRFDSFSARAVAMAVLLGRRMPDEPIRIDMAPAYTAAEAVSAAGTQPAELTAYMQQRYLDHFVPNNPVQ